MAPTTFPPFVYGTADSGSGRPLNTSNALTAGYRAIDTGSTRPYNEDLLGSQLATLLHHDDPLQSLSRSDIIVQAKYSPPSLMAEEISPYERDDIIPLQILKSIAATLSKLQLDYVDVYILHRPLRTLQETYAAWELMEEITREGGARALGISQVDLDTLAAIHEGADVKPVVVQNRFSRRNNFDAEVRQYCKAHGLVYQAFGLLHQENKALLGIPQVRRFAQVSGVSKESALLALVWAMATAEGEKFCVLDGSRDPEHMAENRKALDCAGRIEKDLIEKFRDDLSAIGGPEVRPALSPS